ncbi:MAG: 3-deoxy-D-manno-octulosonic acid transferase [Nitrospinaceae bacterium]
MVGVAILAASPLILARMVLNPSFRSELAKRHRGGRSLPSLSDCLWVHASSVGEVRVAKILIQAMKDLGETRPIALSTFTPTGYDLARKEGIDPVFRLPFDLPYWLNPVFDKLNPSIVILIEAEFWPSLLRQCQRREIPVLLVNGRMSQTSTHRYKKIKPFFHWMTQGVRLFAMRSQTDADRVLSLGVPSEKVVVTGNIKFDFPATQSPTPPGPEKVARPVTLIFGSTRPGDEGPIMEAIRRLREEDPGLNCVIAPRHLERIREVEELIRQYGMEFERDSQIHGGMDGKKGATILVDRMGELNRYYARGTVAFVGGSFHPRFGGHNILEPAAFGIPVIFGKHMDNFQEEAALLKKSGGGIQIDRPGDLFKTLNRLLTRPEELRERGQSAGETIKRHRGAVQKIIELIKKLQTADRKPETVK